MNPRIKTYNIESRMRSGIEFFAKSTTNGHGTLFFWSPALGKAGEVFCKWIPESQTWTMLPIDRLPAGRRVKLLEFWNDRAKIQAELVRDRLAKAKPTPEPA